MLLKLPASPIFKARGRGFCGVYVKRLPSGRCREVYAD